MSYLVFDFETVPDHARWTRTKPLGEDEFPPTWAHRVITAGWVELTAGLELVACGVFDGLAAAGDEDAIERALLMDFSRKVNAISNTDRVLVSYNGRKFDVPVMIARAVLHSVPMPWYFRPRGMRMRYQIDRHIDLCDQLSDYGAGTMAKLDTFCKMIGMPGKAKVAGGDVETMYIAGCLPVIREYCLDDVAQTAMLLARFLVLEGSVRLDEQADLEWKLAKALSKANAFAGEAIAPENCQHIAPAATTEVGDFGGDL